MVVRDDFTVESNRLFSNTELTSGTPDGAGNVYFVGYISKRTRIIKVQESDYSIIFEKEYGHVSQGSAYVKPIEIFVASTSLVLTV